MAKKSIRNSITFLVMTSLSSTAIAQCADSTTNPCIKAKQSDPNRYFQEAYAFPIECDAEITNAASAWSNAGSYFNPVMSPFAPYYNGVYAPGIDGYQITFQPGAEMEPYPTANAITRYGQSVGSVRRPGDNVVIPVINDADTTINSDKYWSYTFECDDATYTTKYDMARTVAHEIGHWVALNHNTNTACATYQIGQMKPFVSLCTAEISAAKSLYGTRP